MVVFLNGVQCLVLVHIVCSVSIANDPRSNFGNLKYHLYHRHVVIVRPRRIETP